MADFATALRARLLADPDVAAATTRIHWGIVPQGSALPYIRLNTAADPRPEHLKGYESARTTRVQCDCMAGTYAAARALAEHVVDAVAPPAAVGGVRFGRTKAEGPLDLGEDTAAGYVFRASLDLLTEHKLA